MTNYINQISQVTAHVFVSGTNPLRNSEHLRKKRITCIVNVTVEEPAPLPKSVSHAIKDYMQVRVEDDPKTDLSSYFDVVADKICKTGKMGGRTLVHCGAGVSRSPTLVLAYLIKHESMTLRAAYYHLKTIRAIISPNVGFWKQLIDYEATQTGHTTVSLLPVMVSNSKDSPHCNISSTDQIKSAETSSVYTFNTGAVTPDVYHESSQWKRDPRQWISRTPQMRPRNQNSSPKKYSSFWPIRRGSSSSTTMIYADEDWNGRMVSNSRMSHGYYRKYSTPLNKRGFHGQQNAASIRSYRPNQPHANTSVFDSFTTMCDFLLPDL